MADQLKQIKEFPNKPDFGDEDLLLIQGAGTTYNVKGTAVKKYAEDSAKPQVALAAAQAQAAAGSAAASEASAVRSETAGQHPPIIDYSTGFWQVWDRTSGTYVPTTWRAMGKDFEILGYYPMFLELDAAVTSPEPGDAYGVGTEAPYDIYIWDGVNLVWKNNGTLLNSGDMTRSVYDPEKKRTDIFAYADRVGLPVGGTAGQILTKSSDEDYDSEWENAPENGVGKSMAGKTVNPMQGSLVTAGDGAEIFNDYRTRTYGSGSNPASSGNIASGGYAHSEGSASTATGKSSHSEGYKTIAGSDYAHAEGWNTSASGMCSHSEGFNTKASSQYAHAEGGSTEASGNNAHSEGLNTKATANYSHAEGSGTEATGAPSHAEGSYTKATNSNSHSEGFQTEASGIDAHAEGYGSKASALCAHAEGFGTEASGGYSHAGGSGTIASKPWQTAIGEANVQSNTFDDKFIIGKGSYNIDNPSSSVRANCFRVNHQGVFASGNYNASGADYAELFEWADGNPDEADRVGRFVTLSGEKIRLAGPGTDYILGIVSGAPSVVGDVYDDQWAGMYLTDVFGRPVWEDVEVPEQTEEMEIPVEIPGEGDEPPRMETRTETRVIIPAHTERRQKLNPAYDPNQKYVPRTERPEWAAVGMLGKLIALEDGSCQVDGWCTAGEGGAAMASEERTRFRVMEKLVDPDTGRKCVRVMILNT